MPYSCPSQTLLRICIIPYLGCSKRSHPNQSCHLRLSAPQGTSHSPSIFVSGFETSDRRSNQNCHLSPSAVPRDQQHLPPYLYLGLRVIGARIRTVIYPCQLSQGTSHALIHIFIEARGRRFSLHCPTNPSMVPRDLPHLPP
jgi:hypothetical protein